MNVPLRSQCAPPKARPAWVRSTSRLEEPAATLAFKAKMATEEAKQIYASTVAHRRVSPRLD